jgi:hypothetical protein
MGIIFPTRYVPTPPVDECLALPTLPLAEWRKVEFKNAVYRTADGGKTAVSDEWVKLNLRWYGGGSRSPEPTLPFFAWDAPWIVRGGSKGKAK